MTGFGFFDAFLRALVVVVLVGAIVFFGLPLLGAAIDAVCALGMADISGQTTRALFADQQETIRFLAEQQGLTTRAIIEGNTSQTWAREMGDSIRTVAALLSAAAVAVVLSWQGGKSFRHWLTERNRQRAILLMYADQFLPEAQRQGRVRIERVRGELMLRDYDTLQQWPVEAAQAALANRGLLPVDSV